MNTATEINIRKIAYKSSSFGSLSGNLPGSSVSCNVLYGGGGGHGSLGWSTFNDPLVQARHLNNQTKPIRQ
jgi:hypothetical protein